MRYTPEQVAGYIIKHGGRGDGVVIGVAVVGRETGGTYDTRTLNPNDSGSPSRGWWQFRQVSHPEIPEADAYSADKSTQWASRKSAGFTNFGPWGIGPDSYRGYDMLPALMATQHWTRARQAALHPTPVSQLPSEDDSELGDYTDGELRLLSRWDVNHDGKLSKSDITTSDETLADTVPWFDDDSKVRRIARALDPFVEDGQIKTGFLLAYKEAIGVSPTAVLGPAAEAYLKRHTINQAVTEGNGSWIFLPGGGILPGNADAVGDIVSGLTPEWMEQLARFLSKLNDASFWRRAGVVLLGALLIAGAIALTVRAAL